MAWVHAVIDLPPELAATGARFWSSVLGWAPGPPWEGHPELRSLEPADGDPYVHLQQIGGPPRVHLDLDSPDPDRTVAAAVDAGATVVGRARRWVALRSPGGLPFCVVHGRDRVAPGPVTWPDGHRSRLVQVCVDAPADRHEAEKAFWQDLLPEGRWVSSPPSSEFDGKWHDDAGAPVQLLFQRLDEIGGPVRAHLDLGTDDRAAEVDRLVALGAEDVRPGRGWHVLRDPAGSEFCVTDNSPEQVARRLLD
ncbi:hypothetical protein GCM10009584_07230 [Ornithinimicrobium humiphilum]|uniref:Glyoxalase-like domain-containing protein n=1 Tax=Ornithinimicrobium humiphilum TaxID=125288 RepID=A0A543KQ83_9MICO|nr:VOC family protein [Ornithinimicrobium humiphilum]TQM97236.1 hypothetical protein FB476_2140 [Ornithinimicrobium humiphilum]